MGGCSDERENGDVECKRRESNIQSNYDVYCFQCGWCNPALPFIFLFVINNPAGFTTNDIFIYSIIFTAASFFCIGFITGRVVNKSPIKSGLITLIIGGIAALVSYMVGTFLSLYI